MNLILSKVESSNLKSYGYDINHSLLAIEFKGGMYLYFGVPANVHAAFTGAESKGKFFDQEIKGRYSYTKITPVIETPAS